MPPPGIQSGFYLCGTKASQRGRSAFLMRGSREEHPPVKGGRGHGFGRLAFGTRNFAGCPRRGQPGSFNGSCRQAAKNSVPTWDAAISWKAPCEPPPSLQAKRETQLFPQPRRRAADPFPKAPGFNLDFTFIKHKVPIPPALLCYNDEVYCA